jgi:hypothetical protein
MHSHSHCQRLGHLLYYLSILFGPLVALCRNVYRFRRLGYNVAPHFAPGWKRKGARKQKETLYGTIIHDREVLAPLSFPKQASSP